MVDTFKKSHYVNLLLMVVYLFTLAFTFNTPIEIFEGLSRILISPSVLVSDYFVIGNVGAAFVNAALVLTVCISIPYFLKVPMNGSLMAALFTIIGFSFFGKNILNMWFIILGVFLYTRMFKKDVSKYIPLAYFSTALSPIISLILFGLNLPLFMAIIIASFVGVFTGWIFPPLAKHFSQFHQGYNLYNSGFTAGIIGMMYVALLRAYNINTDFQSVSLSGFNNKFELYLVSLFVVMFMLGWVQSSNRWSAFTQLIKETGVSGVDFVQVYGFGIALMNMSIVGMIALFYVVLIGGELNGPSIGGILTIVGFGAFGKHIRNITPIMIGVYIAAYFKIWEPHSVSAILAALFGTTLAPIAGKFGWGFGILAGFLHMAMVMNIGFLHGGVNLYNNGFSGGFIAAILVPIVLVLPDFKTMKDKVFSRNNNYE